MYAFDAATGQTLWSFSSGASCIGGAAIADGEVYWGTGYGKFAAIGFPFTPSNKLYAFAIKD
jgi:polyvinyl alcohol dehydrogenase (cytochrome)